MSWARWWMKCMNDGTFIGSLIGTSMLMLLILFVGLFAYVVWLEGWRWRNARRAKRLADASLPVARVVLMTSSRARARA